MTLFFMLVSAVATAIAYVVFPFPITLTIGLSIIVGLILNEIYLMIENNFYMQTAFLVVNAIFSALLTFLMPDVDSKVAMWVIYTLWIFFWCKEWAAYFSEYIYGTYLERYDNEDYWETGEYSEIVKNRNIIEDAKFYLLASPYLIINLIIVFTWTNNPGIAFLSPVVLFIVSLVFLAILKYKGIEVRSMSSDDDDVDSYKSVGDLARNRFKMMRKSFKSSAKLVGLSIKDFFVGIKDFFKNNKDSGNGFSSLMFGLCLGFVGLAALVALLESTNIISTFLKDLDDVLSLFAITKWFPLTQFLWADIGALARSIAGDVPLFSDILYLFLLFAIMIAGLISLVGELILCIPWAIIAFVWEVFISFFCGLIMYTLPVLFAFACLVMIILTFSRNDSWLNKIFAILCFVGTIVCCVLYYTYMAGVNI